MGAAPTKLPAVPRYRQITEILRDRILRGELVPGITLPSMHTLAAEFKTSYFTVHTALGPLVAQGLLERRRRTGTVVRHNSQALTCAAVYCGSGLLDAREEGFATELCRQVQRQLANQDVRIELYLDTRSQVQQHEPLPRLRQAVEQHEVQALIVTRCDHVTLPWLARLPTPTAFVSTADIPNRVNGDHRQLLRLGLERLRDCGCRQVGLICSIHSPVPGTGLRRELRFYRDFIDELRELGLQTHDAWVRVPRQWQPKLESYGYAQFHELWQQAEHPDGILVYPDIVARGVMAAALEKRVSVPDEVKLLFHHNTGVDWVCPLAVDWVESDVAAWAAALIHQVQRQKAGEPVTPAILPYRLVTNGQCNGTKEETMASQSSKQAQSVSRDGLLRAPGQAKRRFTLIELLVVIAIIAILAAMLLPALSGARERGKANVCLGQQKQVALAIILYADDNNEFLPYNVWNWYANGTGSWTWLCRDYLHMASYYQSAVLRCPSINQKGGNREGGGYYYERCGTNSMVTYNDYWGNVEYGGRWDATAGPLANAFTQPYQNMPPLSRFANPSKSFLVYEYFKYETWKGDWGPVSNELCDSYLTRTNPGILWHMSPTFMNAACVDGHAEFFNVRTTYSNWSSNNVDHQYAKGKYWSVTGQ